MEDISLDPIVADLKHPDPATRSQAALVLGLSGNPIVIESLMMVLAIDSEIQVKRSAAIALGNLAHPNAIQPLLLALHDEDDELRTFAAEALAKIPSPLVQETLLMALHGSPMMQLGAMEALICLGKPEALSALEAMGPAVDSRVEAMRLHAISSLGGIAEEAYQSLLKELDSEDSRVRLRAIDGLAKRGMAEFPYLVKALQDPEPNVRAHAVQALGRFGDAGAAYPLVQCLQDSDFYVRSSAGEALVLLADPAMIPALRGAFEGLPEDVRQEPWAQGLLGVIEGVSA